MEDLENSTDEDPFADCCPWLDLSCCHCSCTEYPRQMDVVLTNCTAGGTNIESDFTNCSSDDSDDEVFPIDEIIEEYEEYLVEPDEERETDESTLLFTEYVALRGSSFREDCQATLKKCRQILSAKMEVELRLQNEPDNIRDCNAIIVQAKVNSQWDRIGYIPKEKVPKFTSAIRNNEFRLMKFKNIKCQFIMTDYPKWTYLASVLVTKTGKWLPNDGLYKYNDNL